MKEESAAALLPLFDAVCRQIRGAPPDAPPVLSFYRYVNTKSTMRYRNGRLHVRISDHLKDAPDAAIRGLFGTLLCRLDGLSIGCANPDDVRAYNHWLDQEDVAARRRSSRQRRGRKHLDPVGDHRSLLESYLRVSLAMDLQLADAPRLGWSRTRSTRRFGHHDGDHDCIILSRALDDPKVPEFVLDFVVYHELLHIVHPPRMGSGNKRIVHPREFRAAEARFPQRKEAEAWLTRIARAG